MLETSYNRDSLSDEAVRSRRPETVKQQRRVRPAVGSVLVRIFYTDDDMQKPSLSSVVPCIVFFRTVYCVVYLGVFRQLSAVAVVAADAGSFHDAGEDQEDHDDDASAHRGRTETGRCAAVLAGRLRQDGSLICIVFRLR